jgi:ABC-type uncharacterized transport system permease subunit
MDSIPTLTFLTGWLTASVRLSTPLAFPSLGQVFTQRSGVLDMGVEAMMMAGALAGFAGSFFSANPWVGALFGLLAGALVGMIAAFFYVGLGADQVLTGVILVITLGGLVTVVNRIIFGGSYIPPQSAGFQTIAIPYLADLPFLGPILFQHNILTYASWVLAPIAYAVLNWTSIGLNIRAVGENPRAADSQGINVKRIRYLCTAFGGAMSGLGGAFLTLGYMNMYVDDLTGGRGWIALSLVIFSQWNPLMVLAGALFFGGVGALQLRFQSAGVGLAPQLLQMLPYVLTIAALVLISRRGSGPGALGIPYRKEEA